MMNQDTVALPGDPGLRVSFLSGGLVVGEGFLLHASCRFIPFLYFHPPMQAETCLAQPSRSSLYIFTYPHFTNMLRYRWFVWHEHRFDDTW